MEKKNSWADTTWLKLKQLEGSYQNFPNVNVHRITTNLAALSIEKGKEETLCRIPTMVILPNHKIGWLCVRFSLNFNKAVKVLKSLGLDRNSLGVKLIQLIT